MEEDDDDEVPFAIFGQETIDTTQQTFTRVAIQIDCPFIWPLF